MSSKLLVILASGEKETVLTGLMYARNAIKRGWMEDVQVVFFGPSEKLMVEDAQVSDAAKEMVEMTNCRACKAISDREDISGKVEELGVKVEYVGSVISDLIKEGYTPMVW